MNIENLLSKVSKYQPYRTGDDVDRIPDGASRVAFSCPICGEVYFTHAEAEHCRTQAYDTADMRVGDIVVVPDAFHNSYVKPGSPWWAFTIPADPSSNSHFDRVPHHIPYYVVTALHTDYRDPHQAIITLARVSQDEDVPFLHFGWNPLDGAHNGMYRVRDKLSMHCDYWVNKHRELFDNCEPCAILQSEAAELAALGISTRNLL
jgi:predicted RNA-binding Zn-ribbon protein involved in translation (DUF1610 family)